MATKLSIIVWRGDPIDAYVYRHTALLFQYPDNTDRVVHIIGARGFFTFEARTTADPTTSAKFVSKIDVASVQGQSRTSLELALASVQIINDDPSWNCQNWIGDALAKFVQRAIMTADQRTRGLEAMVDVLLEAPDSQ